MAQLIAHLMVPTEQGILLLRRTAFERGKPNVFPHYWDFPGGLVQPHEFPRDAAIRECYEETGLTVIIRRIVAEDSHLDLHRGTVFTRLVYLAEAVDLNHDQRLHLNLTEHDRLRFVTTRSDLGNPSSLVSYVAAALNEIWRN